MLPEHLMIYNPSLQYSTTDSPSVQSSYETPTTTETENTSTKYEDLQTASSAQGYDRPGWGLEYGRHHWWFGRPWWVYGRPGWWYGRPGWVYGRPGWGYGPPGWGLYQPRYLY